jgi:hypothetical protein
MIVRISSTAVPESGLTAYSDYVQKVEIPAYEAASGLVSVTMVRRNLGEYVEVLTFSIWQSEDALLRFGLPNQDVMKEYDGVAFGVREYETVLVRQGPSPEICDIQSNPKPDD